MPRDQGPTCRACYAAAVRAVLTCPRREWNAERLGTQVPLPGHELLGSPEGFLTDTLRTLRHAMRAALAKHIQRSAQTRENDGARAGVTETSPPLTSVKRSAHFAASILTTVAEKRARVRDLVARSFMWMLRVGGTPGTRLNENEEN